MTKYVFIKGARDEYSPEPIARHYGCLTVGELIDYLQNNFDENAKIILNNDNGYTFGRITEDSIWTDFYPDNEDEWNSIMFDDLLDIELEDDDSEFGGIAFMGETVRDFLWDCGEKERPHNIIELNRMLKECGIKPIVKE